MLRLVFLFVFLYQGLYAFLSTNDNYQEQIKVLKILDIDPRFLTDSVFISMKNSADLYRTQHFLKVLENGNRFVPVLRSMLQEANIPEAFLSLAMAESNFSAIAYSNARASGLWQFMPYTAQKFGLKINLYVDERRDPIKSTRAAIEYLKYLHDRFGKWYLAALAYNCGEGRLDRAIQKAGTDDLATLLDEQKKYLPLESRLYIRKIIILEEISNSEDFLVGHESAYLLNRGTTNTYEVVHVNGGATLGSIAQSVEMSDKELRAYNAQFLYGFTPPAKRAYTVYLPYGKKKLFEQNFDASKDDGRFYVHKIQKGDSLYALGKKYGVSYKLIKDFNKLSSNILSLNQKLIIPVVKPRAIQYVIKSGDTLGKISERFNVKMTTLMQVNNKKDTLLILGERLVIPNVY